MADVGEVSSTPGAMFGRATWVFFMAANKQLECNKNEKGLRSKTLELASTQEDWMSCVDRTMGQQAREVMRPHQTIDWMSVVRWRVLQ